MGKTHMVAGSLFVAAAGPPVAVAFGVELAPAVYLTAVAAGTITGLLPDIDHPDALLTRGWIPGRRLLGPVSKLAGLLISIPPRIVGMAARSVMGHRGGTHSLLFCAFWTVAAVPMYALLGAAIAWLVSLVLGTVGFASFDPAAVWAWEREHMGVVMPVAMLTVALGYLSHLATDSLNTVPVPWLWPFTKRRFFFLPKGLRITVDTPTEWLVRQLLTLLLAAALVIGLVQPLVGRVQAGEPIVQALTRPLGSELPPKRSQVWVVGGQAYRSEPRAYQGRPAAERWQALPPLDD